MNESTLNNPCATAARRLWSEPHAHRGPVQPCNPTAPNHENKYCKPQDISPENVSVAAYHRWLAAGKPSGRDQEFWLKAEMDLRKMVSQIPPASQPRWNHAPSARSRTEPRLPALKPPPPPPNPP